MDYTILVNKENRLDKNFVPDNLVITDQNENNFHNYINPSLKPQIDKYVFMHFLKMQLHAKLCGFNIIIDSGYRSYEYQQDVWDSNVKEFGLEKTTKFVAPPGASEHQSGFAFDVAYIINGKYTDDINESQEETKWLFVNSYKYGFILRYPKGKENITGYNYEPWHYRFVGILLAYELFNDNITLEEYYLKREFNKCKKIK